jgi:hypothetical protein
MRLDLGPLYQNRGDRLINVHSDLIDYRPVWYRQWRVTLRSLRTMWRSYCCDSTLAQRSTWRLREHRRTFHRRCMQQQLQRKRKQHHVCKCVDDDWPEFFARSVVATSRLIWRSNMRKSRFWHAHVGGNWKPKRSLFLLALFRIP